MDVKKNRRDWLEVLARRVGTLEGLARQTDTNASYLTQIRRGTLMPSGEPREMGDRVARRIEVKLALPKGTMDTPCDASGVRALHLVPAEDEETFDDEDLTVTMELNVHSLAYHLFEVTQDLPFEVVDDILSYATRKAREHNDNQLKKLEEIDRKRHGKSKNEAHAQGAPGTNEGTHPIRDNESAGGQIDGDFG